MELNPKRRVEAIFKSLDNKLANRRLSCHADAAHEATRQALGQPNMTGFLAIKAGIDAAQAMQVQS